LDDRLAAVIDRIAHFINLPLEQLSNGLTVEYMYYDRAVEENAIDDLTSRMSALSC
jgi:hypothetical protein